MVGGPQKDWTVGLGLGRSLPHSLFVELDAGLTCVGGEPSASLVPGVGWAFHPNFYSALRVIVPVHPEVGVAIDPGVGALFALDRVIAIFGELNLLGNVAPGDPDVGITLTVGTTITL
jgi:hypothetical protein